jgi:hypothetical protein
MKQKRSIYNLLIVDESGSMSSICQQTVSGYQHILETIGAAAKINPETSQYVSLVCFNSGLIRWVFDKVPVKKALNHGPIDYEPNGGTPLWDATGLALAKLQAQIFIGDHKKQAVFVSILTDGYENASTKFNERRISRLIEQLQMQNWSFTYIGTDHDVQSVADQIHIPRGNQVQFERSQYKTGGLKKISRAVQILNEQATRDDFWDGSKGSISDLMQEQIGRS